MAYLQANAEEVQLEVMVFRLISVRRRTVLVMCQWGWRCRTRCFLSKPRKTWLGDSVFFANGCDLLSKGLLCLKDGS
jgi:hypothetical protein